MAVLMAATLMPLAATVVRCGAEHRMAFRGYQLGTTKPAANTVAAYRRDLEGVARRIAADADVGVLDLEHPDQRDAAGRLCLLGRRSRCRLGGGRTRRGPASSTSW